MRPNLRWRVQDEVREVEKERNENFHRLVRLVR